jgi:penicillin V acylase-like amidase (Ntn superfamily)
MKIYGVHSVEEYKTARDKLIQNWVDQHFVKDSVTWELSDPLHITVTDQSGDSMIVHLDQVDGHYIAD